MVIKSYPFVIKSLVVGSLLMAGFAVAGSPSAGHGAVVTADEKVSMKGMELYSWQVNGEWRYVICNGTNRLKTASEIISPTTFLQSIVAVEAAFHALPKHEQVIWMNPSPFTYPPRSEIDKIKEAASRAGVRLTMKSPSLGKWVGDVEQLTEQPDRVTVSFRQFSAVYFLYRDHPEYDAYRRLLEHSVKKKRTVRFDYDVEGQRITYIGMNP